MAKLFNVTSSGSGKMKLDKIQIASHPTKTVYKSGESFDPSGMTIEALYTNGAARMVTGYTVSPMTLTDDVTAVTVSFAEAGIVRTADQEVTVLPILADIEIASAPHKIEYLYLESFDPAGMTVNAIYSDGSKEAVTDFTYQETTFNTLGTHEIAVSYTKDGITKTTTQIVSVSEALIDIPTQSGALVYNGSTQSPTWTGYNANTMDISGTTSAVNAGTYQAIFTLKYGYLWEDKTNASTNVAWVVGRASVSIPSQSGGLTYTGSSQTPSWNDYNSSQLTIDGTTSGTNAGTYNATFTPTANYQWSDGNTTAKAVSWSIGKAIISTIPYQRGRVTYNGSSQSPYWEDYDSSKMTIGGTVSAINAGRYDVTFTPTSNYQWRDGTTSAKSTVWDISKADSSISVYPTSLSLTSDNKIQTISVTKTGDGSISATSSNTSVVTVSVSDTTVTVTGVGNGSTTIRIKVESSVNYYETTSKIVNVTAQLLPDKAALNDMSWAEIRQVSDAEQGANYWSVGDRKGVLVNGTVGTLAVNQTLYVYILGFNHNSTKEGAGIQFGTFKSALSGGTDVCLVDSTCGFNAGTNGAKAFAMNHWGNYNYGGWKACDMRYDILGSTNQAPSGYGSAKTTSSTGYNAPTNTATSPVANTLMAALPSDLRAVMKPIIKYTDGVGNGSNVSYNVTETVDYLPLLAEFEIFGSRSYANRYEQDFQAQYSYYSAGNSKTKYRHSSTGSDEVWWERSPLCLDENYFCCVGTGGYAGTENACGSCGLASAFMV